MDQLGRTARVDHKRVFEVNGWACPHCTKPMTLRSIVIREPAATQVVSGLLLSTGPPAAA